MSSYTWMLFFPPMKQSLAFKPQLIASRRSKIYKVQVKET